MTKRRETVEQAARLMNIAVGEVDSGAQDAIAEYARGRWRATRPASSSLSLETRWRSSQLAAMQLGKPTICFPCWRRQLDLWRQHAPESARKDVAEQCCGMIGCPGPLVEADA